MRDNLMKGWKLARYGVNFKLQLAFMIVFFVIGTVVTLVTENTVGVLDTGTVFLLCTAMFPAQMVLSVDLGSFVYGSFWRGICCRYRADER